ncbi:CWF19-like protein 1 [Acropora cervicornis]|uniref:CWF19-like protein 1 n=1 Tax=Acropora cervicornis TaxID=6130 RepID=A0AAD9QW20_ACRCE|nr:CWF19-like protein 1 [Acropora cervicornis]
MAEPLKICFYVLGVFLEQVRNPKRIPIPTYILGPTEKLESSYFSEVSLENGGELCENVTYLGRKGILKTQSGVQIAYLSGVEKSEAPEDGCHFSQDDILALESQCQDESFKGLDILITSCWPRSVSQFASRPDGIDPDRCGSSQISRLAEQLKPRYHFAGHEGVHYERAPYSIVPMASMDESELVKQPPDALTAITQKGHEKDHSYVALAKGGLVPDHVLICPIGHFESSVKLSEDVLMEIEKYKSALRKCFHSEGKSCIIFERNFYTQHLQLQAVPVPHTDVEELKDIFIEHGESSCLALKEVAVNTELKQAVPIGAPYFVVEFDNGERLLHRVLHKMPLQFGREVLASPSLLNMVDRVDWKACKVSVDDEKKIVAAFRKKFQPFDFNAI